MIASWSSPPAARAFGRSGCANRRSFGRQRRGQLRGGGEALLGRPLRLDRARLARLRRALRRRRGALRLRVALGQRELAPLDLARLRHGVGLGDLGEAGVEVRVAVAVLQLDEVAALARVAEARDAAVLHGDHRRALAREDVDRAARAVGLDRPRGVLARLEALLELRVGQRAGVGRLGRDGEAALRQARERADEVGREAADDARAHEHRLDVPVGVVVGEDRAVEVGVGAGGAQVAGGGEDRVDRVERVLLAVAVGVDAVGGPRGGHELHPAERAGGGDVQVAAVVGLDLVDRGQDLPAHAVLDAGGLVDREQERRDPELLDEEVGDADRGRPGGRERVARVRRGRDAAGGVARGRRVGGALVVAGVILVALLVRLLLDTLSSRGRG